jgi:putative salt-induced outer membrane protein
MRVRIASLIAGLACSLTLASRASAQNKAPLSANVDLGFVNTAGNTDVTTLNAGEKIGYTSGAFTVGEFFSAVYGRTEGVTSASDWKAGVRGDYAFTKHLGVFVLGNFERNTFAGFNWYLEQAAGIAATLLDGGGNLLKAEVGASYDQQRSTTDSTDKFVAARGAASYRRNLTDAAYIQEAAEVLPDLKESKDLRINSETALVAPISKRIAVKLSYTVRFDNLPEPGFKKTDRIFTSGLQIAF